MMRARRRLLPEERRLQMSAAVASRLCSVAEVNNARHIHLYLSFGDELSTAGLPERLLAMGKVLSVPVVQEGRLVSSSFRAGEPLLRSSFGQPEPAAFSLADERSLDLVVMPLLAFDDDGYRLGYGKGLYDRFLQRLAEDGIYPFRIGLAFSLQRVEHLDVDPWDEPLDGVVHEEGVIRFTKQSL